VAREVAAREMIIEFLNSKVGEEVTVEMISSVTGLSGRVVRRHLRKLRDFYVRHLEYTIQGGRLVYKVIKPIPVPAPEAEEEVQLEAETKVEVEEKPKVEETIEAAAGAEGEKQSRRRRGRKKKEEAEVQEALEGIQ
jgi:DNA-binding transcriptional ArsR family regulator